MLSMIGLRTMDPFLALTGVFSQCFYYAIVFIGLLFILRRFKRNKNIKGHRILITGAGNGLGRQLAILLSKQSVCLMLLDIDQAALNETEMLLERHSTVFIYQCDVSDKKLVQEVAKKIEMEVGNVDILINNAGVVSGNYFLDLSEEKIKKTMEVNVLAHFWLCQAFLPSMMARNSGHIVSVASILGVIGQPRMTDYCASKSAAIGFAKSLEMEMRYKKLDGIKVTIVCPCHINTGLFDGAKMGVLDIMTAEYAAEEILKGILMEKETIFLPHRVKYLIMMNDLSPRWLSTWFQDIIGDLKCMENFTGKKNKFHVQEQNK